MVGRFHVRTEGRVGEDEVEAVLEDAVDVVEAIPVMHAAVTVSVHDHVHLAGAGHAVVGVAAVDVIVAELPHAGVPHALVKVALGLLVFLAQRGGFLRRGKAAGGRDLPAVVAILRICAGINLLPHTGEKADEEAAGAAGGIAYYVTFLRVGHLDHEAHDLARGEELADLTTEGATKETLEGDAFHIFDGLAEVVFLEQAHDLLRGGDFELDALVRCEELVVPVAVAQPGEEIVQRVVTKLLLHDFDCEEVFLLLLPAHLPLDIDFHEENFSDLIERGGRVELVAVADDVVALVKEVGELVFLEDKKLREQFFNFLVRDIGTGDVRDFLKGLRHLLVERAPVAGLAAVVGDEELGVAEPGVVIALFVVFGLDGDVVALALDDDQRGVLIRLVLGGAPDDEVGAGLRTAAPSNANFLIHLRQLKAVFVHKHAEISLAHEFFWGFVEPTLADVAEYLAGFGRVFLDD